MAALEEPTTSELIRDIDERTRRMEQSMVMFVPRELYDTHRAQDERRFAQLEAKGRQWWTVFALPAMVGAFVLLIQEVLK